MGFIPSPNGWPLCLYHLPACGPLSPSSCPLLPGTALTGGHTPGFIQRLAQARALRHFKEGPYLTAKGDLECFNLLSASHRLWDLEKFLDFLWILVCFIVVILLKKKKKLENWIQLTWKCSNYRTTTLISHARKVMLKILQARLQQYMNLELPDGSSWI